MTGDADEGVDIAKIAANEFGAIEDQGIRRGEFIGEAGLLDLVGIGSKKNLGKLIEILRREIWR